MQEGLSTNRHCHPFADCLAAEGKRFVVRYRSRTTQQPQKRISPQEAAELARTGLEIATVYQDNPPAGRLRREARCTSRSTRTSAHRRSWTWCCPTSKAPRPAWTRRPAARARTRSGSTAPAWCVSWCATTTRSPAGRGSLRSLRSLRSTAPASQFTKRAVCADRRAGLAGPRRAMWPGRSQGTNSPLDCSCPCLPPRRRRGAPPGARPVFAADARCLQRQGAMQASSPHHAERASSGACGESQPRCLRLAFSAPTEGGARVFASSNPSRPSVANGPTPDSSEAKFICSTPSETT